jgi:hypothetical protein
LAFQLRHRRAESDRQQINPILLVPLGDRWLIESRAEFEGQFQRPLTGGPYQGPVTKHVDYAQIDYIANPYVTVTAGRFLTPFGIFNERLYPVWIRSLQPDPLILPHQHDRHDGLMLRGGFPVNAKANMNYAVYVSATSIGLSNRGLRAPGRRAYGLLFSRSAPRSRRLLAAHSAGRAQERVRFSHHWQSSKAPSSVRSEFAHSFEGSGYWLESAYRLSQLHFWQKEMRHTELVAGRPSSFIPERSAPTRPPLSACPAPIPAKPISESITFQDGLKGIFSYGRQFSSAGNANQWSFGLAYRFLVPLGRVGAQP